ncbi:hypothetical protein P8452_06953 [Trifolium repens]|jgi:hypothetical protein|nr:hypothetical protein P8452_06953 [Trifolium repens]
MQPHLNRHQSNDTPPNSSPKQTKYHQNCHRRPSTTQRVQKNHCNAGTTTTKIRTYAAICCTAKLPKTTPRVRKTAPKDISFVEMKMVAASILWKFHIQAVEGHSVTPKISIALRMEHGFKVKVNKRCD